ncbi:MAG TPA: AgmX/PglI C-terminal domain-containing protein [Candidatus Angelobacter sp.]|nr:AgmX/PglI C-terminal domain-containing protein [Candidatus Angelobacter sp.]
MTTMEISRRMFRESGAPSARSMAESIVLHVVMLALLMLVGASLLARSGAPRTKKEIDIVFYRPAAVPVTPTAVPPPPAKGTGEAKAKASEAPKGPGKPDLPAGPEKGFSADPKPPEPNVGTAGILKYKDQFASLAQDQNAPRLGSDARYSAADEVGQASLRSVLTTNTPGSSGGIDAGSLSRSVGGGGGRGGGGGGMGGPGVQVARAKSSIAGIGGGDGRPKAHSGPGASRTDEEIQIVFDRYKSAFYRDYNRALRSNPTLQGKMVLRLTIEPDGAVSMCQLQSTDMDAPDLAAQVVSRVKTINFGAKDVPAVTIVYPIDFLPAT